jgi:hypothetical protein
MNMSKNLFLDFQSDILQIITEDNTGAFNHEHIPFDTSRPFSIEEVKDRIRQQLTDGNLQRVTWFDSNFTLIPMSMFMENELETYYQLNFGKLASGFRILHEPIHALQLVVVYTVPSWILELAQGTLLQTTVHSHISFLLNKQFHENSSDSTYLVLFDQTFVLSVKQHGKLQLCLPTEYQSATDVLYFILSNHQKMNLSKSNTLSAYVLNAHFDQETFESLWSQFKDFNDFSTHFYSQAAYQKTILCASSVVS